MKIVSSFQTPKLSIPNLKIYWFSTIVILENKIKRKVITREGDTGAVIVFTFLKIILHYLVTVLEKTQTLSFYSLKMQKV